MIRLTIALALLAVSAAFAEPYTTPFMHRDWIRTLCAPPYVRDDIPRVKHCLALYNRVLIARLNRRL